MTHNLFVTAVAATLAVSASASPLWMRDPAISPDGTQIVFAYKGDLWRVPVGGGGALRLTATEDYEASPVWSPDGRFIAFSSDRHGNDDIFIMPAYGGTPARLTYNSAAETPQGFSSDGKYVLFSASIQDPATSVMFPTSRQPELYKVPANGGTSLQVLGTPAQSVSFVDKADGPFLYEDMRGYENAWRKHQTSSVAHDIWRYNPADGSHTNLTAYAGEDRNPVVVGDNFYFLSERDGKSINVWRAPLADPSAAVQVTKMREHPVRFLSASHDGTLCFGYDGEIYTLRPGGKPAKVDVSVIDDITSDPYKLSLSRPTEMCVSPDGKSLAFISRGNVFVTSVEYTTTKQISDTPEGERWITWGPDSRTLYYASERDGNFNIYKATMARAEDPNFANATVIKEEPVFKTDKHERTVPKMSPDGKHLAFVLDRNVLAVRDMKSGKVKTLTDPDIHKHRDGTYEYSWSPDSKWIVLEASTRDPYTDIAIVNVEDGTMHYITRSGYFDEQPHWSADGNAIIFASEKYGMRSHASWGSMYDVMITFLNQESYDKFRLNKEDAELAEEKERKDKKDDKKAEKDSTIVIEPDGFTDRTVRLTPVSTQLRDAILTADGKSLFFISQAANGNTLWEIDMRDLSTKQTKSISSGLSRFQTSADGKKLFITGSSASQLTPSGAKLTSISYSGQQVIDPMKERQYMFDNIVREERERFYDTGMHGVNWTALTDHYRKFLPHIANNRDFSEMLSEMLGELNVSHTGGRLYGSTPYDGDRTASLGLLYDLNYTGKGLKVDEVVTKTPFDNAASKVVPGVIIEKINGVEITPENDCSILLTDMAGKKVLVSIYDPVSGERWDEVVKPISTSTLNERLYQRWIASRADEVDRLSGGRLGYVHIRSMNDASFREVYADLLGKYADKEGVVIDIRWNSGGRMHEDIEVLFSGEKYLTQVIRGRESCDMPSRRWNKPSVMLVSEACYSNAHGTPWVYRHKNIGKIVGTPVPGTMTSVNWVTMQDPSMYFGIPVIGYRTAEGTYLENSQLEPDVYIANDPATVVLGQDMQLEKAVETLLQQLDAK